MSPSTDGVLMANNLFYFERPAVMVVGDQKRNELGGGYLPNTLCSNNLYLTTDSWPSDSPVKDRMPFFGNPQFFRQGGVEIADYRCRQISMVADRGCKILPLPQDSIGLRIGMDPGMDILGHAIVGLPDIGAIEHVLPVAALK